ncbi:MAG: PIN domain-containing protein [Lachnospiraceae bacterium]|nr:PIN domain-containing protein [Lachnospiraceae bacterium]
MKWLRNIVEGYILDANYICRYLLEDQYDQFLAAKELIDNNRCCIRFEILEEVVYVLEKLYEIPREEIKTSVLTILNRINIRTSDNRVIEEAFRAYSQKPKIDFVDCLLYGYYKAGYKVATFDKKLQKRMNIIVS